MSRRRRRHSEPRPHRVSVRLSESELWALKAAAEAARMSLGAWVADVAIQAAGSTIHRPQSGLRQLALREAFGELNRCRTQLAKAGGLLNQAVAALHSGSDELERLAAIAEFVRRRVDQLDGRIDELWERLP